MAKNVSGKKTCAKKKDSVKKKVKKAPARKTRRDQEEESLFW